MFACRRAGLGTAAHRTAKPDREKPSAAKLLKGNVSWSFVDQSIHVASQLQFHRGIDLSCTDYGHVVL